MTAFQSWMARPRATIRLNTTFPWMTWMKTLRRTFISDKPDRRPRIEVLDRLSLGGKKSLLLIAIEQRRLLIGVGEGAVPSILSMEDRRQISPSTLVAVRNGVALRKRKRVH